MLRRQRLGCRAALLGGMVVLGCGQQATPADVRALEAAGDVSFVCVGADFSPRRWAACPDQDPVDGETRSSLLLATQLSRGEVAVMQLLPGTPPARLIDVEPHVPGVGFLPVGERPTDIVSTPGGVATFVSVAEPGSEGIFALPTSCLGPPRKGEPPRDLTSWPACRLPSAPGEMVVVLDEGVDDDGLAATPRRPRASCDQPEPAEPTAAPGSIAAQRALCPADLGAEVSPPGRRLLLVTLPDRAELVLIDAAALLDRAPGSFDPCPIERAVPLEVSLPSEALARRLPADFAAGLPASGGACAIDGATYQPPGGVFTARPSGLAYDAARPQTLYIGDLDAPVIHVFDLSDACQPHELAPLLPASFKDPERLVTTTQLALTPALPSGGRFLYAIDERDDPAASVMIFDVGPLSTERTPLIRPGAIDMPFEAPDRIAFDAPAQALAMVSVDEPRADAATGVTTSGQFCDPDPSADPSSAGAAHRPASDFSSGARPSELRGVFGMVGLDSGQLAVIDVEDLDAPCRRPVSVNPSAVEDFRGCRADPFTHALQDTEGRRTVSDEVSCQVVEPHRVRSAWLFSNDTGAGVRAPSLRYFPKLSAKSGRSLPTDASEDGRQHPRMLAVDFTATQPARVYVGTTEYRNEAGYSNRLVTDPTKADRSSLVLDYVEPRAHPPSESLLARYEGRIVAEREIGRLRYDGGATLDLTDGDPGLVFCDQGVEDVELMRERGRRMGVDPSLLTRFGWQHADFVLLTGALPAQADVYWGLGKAGASCGEADPKVAGAGYNECRGWFGSADAPTQMRELRVVEAYADHLVVEPRRYSSDADRDFKNALVSCCFPSSVAYTLRAPRQWIVAGSRSGFRHAVTTGPTGGRCIRDCSPLASKFDARVFESTCHPAAQACFDETGKPLLGVAQLDGKGVDPLSVDLACVLRDPSQVPFAFEGSRGCVFSNLTSHFAMYRGVAPSERDMAFAWEVAGGFSPQYIWLTSQSQPVAIPQRMTFSRELGELVVTDATTQGVDLINLRTLTLSTVY